MSFFEGSSCSSVERGHRTCLASVKKKVVTRGGSLLNQDCLWAAGTGFEDFFHSSKHSSNERADTRCREVQRGISASRPSSAPPCGRRLASGGSSIQQTAPRGCRSNTRPLGTSLGDHTSQRRPATAGICRNLGASDTVSKFRSCSTQSNFHAQSKEKRQACLDLSMQEVSDIQRSVKEEDQAPRKKCQNRQKGAVRSASLSQHRRFGSGLFSDVLPLEASEAEHRIEDGQRKKREVEVDIRKGALATDEGSARQRRMKEVDASGKSQSHSQPWRSIGACANTIRAPFLSRTRGATTSGLFSDVQCLASSESDALIMERRGRTWRPQSAPKPAIRRSRRSTSTRRTCESSLQSTPNLSQEFVVDRRLPHVRIADEYSDSDSDKDVISEDLLKDACKNDISNLPLKASQGGA